MGIFVPLFQSSLALLSKFWIRSSKVAKAWPVPNYRSQSLDKSSDMPDANRVKPSVANAQGPKWRGSHDMAAIAGDVQSCVDEFIVRKGCIADHSK
jgi:hypothetical protein